MKTVLAFAVLTFAVVAQAHVTPKDPIACFERKWLVLPTAESNLTVAEVGKIIENLQKELPVLKVSASRDDFAIVSYKNNRKNFHEFASDKMMLMNIFEDLKAQNVIVECDEIRILEKFPGMIGRN